MQSRLDSKVVQTLGQMPTTRRPISTLQIGDVSFHERPGGLSRVYYELQRHLPSVNVSFQGLVVGRNQTDHSIETFARSDASMHHRLIRSYLAIRRALANKKFDLVASHFALYTFPSLSQLQKIPIVVHFHGPWGAEGGVEGGPQLSARLKTFLEKRVYTRASSMIVLSNAFARELVERYRVPEAAVNVVPGGVDTSRFNCQMKSEEARKLLQWPADQFIVLSVRRLAHRMGLENLIEATKSLSSRNRNVAIYIIGEGVLSQELQSQIDTSGLSGKVRLLGRLDENLLPIAYTAADLSIVPSTTLEGFGMTTLESLASGTPVLVTPVGGMPEIVGPLSCDLILEGCSASEIAQGMAEVMSGERKLPTAAECQSYAGEHFSWSAAAERTRCVYEKVLQA